jgi:hypothetical protein
VPRITTTDKVHCGVRMVLWYRLEDGPQPV